MNSRSLLLLAVGLLGTVATPAYADLDTPFAKAGEVVVTQGHSLPTLVGMPVNDLIARVAQTNGTSELFTWSAQKADGAVTLVGSTPNSAIKSFLTVRAGAGADDQMQVAKGGPDDFIDNSLAGLAALSALNSGRVAFTGRKWTLSGYADDQNALDGLLSTLESAVDLSDWLVFVEVKAPVEAAAAPVAEPEPEAEAEVATPPEMALTLLKWSVRRDADGNLSFEGMVPTAALKSFLQVRAGEGATDNSEVGGTPPPDFINSALAAVEAVKALQSGRAAYTGSKWTLGGYADSQEAIDTILTQLAGSVDANDWVIFIQVAPGMDSAAAEPDFQFNALKSDGGAIALSGNTPSPQFASYAAVISGGDSSALAVQAPAPEGFIGDAVAALRALNTLESGRLAYEDGQWSLTGDALSDADAASVSAAITGLPDGDTWALDLTVVPVFPLCVAVVAEFSDTHTILFAPGSARLTPESAEALVDLAAELKKCPAADLHVEGHTDADGPEDSNMALSVARSEAVISELISLGLDDRRLYAIGYGETLPVATNDTVAGKAQNRRIVFELVR